MWGMRFLKFGKRRSTVVIVSLLALVLLVGAGVTWCKKVYSTPENVFNRMLSNALNTTSVTKQSIADSEAQTLVQTTRLQTYPEGRVHSVVDISQGNEEQRSYVKRETITTPTTSFVRLVDVQTTQKNASGQPYDFSPVLGVWGTTPAGEGENSISMLYGQNVAIPYAHLSASGRHKVLEQIKNDNVYNVNYSTVKTVSVNGRKAYTYEIKVKPQAFINMMKAVGKQVGVKGFDDVDAADYKNLPDVSFTFTVDVLSSDLVGVDYGNGQTETYSGAGLRSIARDPSDAVTMAELQQRLQSLQR
jgi:hypothetical protein